VNILINGDFAGGQSAWPGNASVQLPDGWSLFAFKSLDQRAPEACVMDMGAPQTLGRIWKIFMSYSAYEYALGQRVQVPVGSQLVFRASVWAWSSGQDDPMRSLNGGSYHTRIGIDPFGGMEWRSKHIIWDYPSLGHKVMDCRDAHTVAAVAEAGIVTVWLSGRHEWALKHGDAYWFNAELESLYTPEPPSGDEWHELALSNAARIRAIEDFLASFRKE